MLSSFHRCSNGPGNQRLFLTSLCSPRRVLGVERWHLGPRQSAFVLYFGDFGFAQQFLVLVGYFLEAYRPDSFGPCYAGYCCPTANGLSVRVVVSHVVSPALPVVVVHVGAMNRVLVMSSLPPAVSKVSSDSHPENPAKMMLALLLSEVAPQLYPHFPQSPYAPSLSLAFRSCQNSPIGLPRRREDRNLQKPFYVLS